MNYRTGNANKVKVTIWNTSCSYAVHIPTRRTTIFLNFQHLISHWILQFIHLLHWIGLHCTCMLPMALLICTFKRYLTRQIHKHSFDDLVNQVAPSDGSNLMIQFQFVNCFEKWRLQKSGCDSNICGMGNRAYATCQYHQALTPNIEIPLKWQIFKIRLSLSDSNAAPSSFCCL